MADIRQQNDPVLRQKADLVKSSEFGSTQLTKIIKDMKKALAEQSDGVAIAAPQIGVSKQIFIVSHQTWKHIKGGPETKEDLVFINPTILKKSKTKELMDEGCLSVRWWYGKVERSTKVSVEALNETGQKFIWNGSGLIAQIFQHEIDHLEGTLFIDKAVDLQEIEPSNQ